MLEKQAHGRRISKICTEEIDRNIHCRVFKLKTVYSTGQEEEEGWVQGAREQKHGKEHSQKNCDEARDYHINRNS